MYDITSDFYINVFGEVPKSGPGVGSRTIKHRIGEPC